MKTSTILAWGVIIIIVIALGLYALDAAYPATYSSIFPGGATSTTTGTTGSTSGENTSGATGAVTYYCQQGQISATFSASAVQLSLSDGRYLTLPQVPSGSGVQYEATSSGKDMLFASKGDSATFSENKKATYANCVAAHVADAGGGYKGYISQAGTFSFIYPNAFSIVGTEPGYTMQWAENATTTGLLLAEVQLPGNTMPKTNFSDAKFTVGTSVDPAAVKSCLQAGNGSILAGTVTINGVAFTKLTLSDAGAGNLYNTTSYRLVRGGQCYAVEYTIHSTQLANYPASAGIKAFDQAKVTAELTAIATSFKFLK